MLIVLNFKLKLLKCYINSLVYFSVNYLYIPYSTKNIDTQERNILLCTRKQGKILILYLEDI